MTPNAPQECEHNKYWRTVYDNCMACRAEKAEADNRALAERVGKLGAQLAETRMKLSATERQNGQLRADIVTTATRLADAQARLKELEAQHKNLVTRNQILRTRPDLPMTDPEKAAHKQLERQHAALREALTSIAHNTCCGPCREASLVARKALATGAEVPRSSSSPCGHRDCDGDHT